MKVRVLKEIPFAKVGEVKDYNCGYMFGCSIELLIKDGWLEEVKETKLEEQIKNTITKYILHVIAATRPKEAAYFINLITQNDIILEICQIAKEHYLEVIDKATDEIIQTDHDRYEAINHIKKAIKEA